MGRSWNENGIRGKGLLLNSFGMNFVSDDSWKRTLEFKADSPSQTSGPASPVVKTCVSPLGGMGFRVEGTEGHENGMLMNSYWSSKIPSSEHR